MILGIGYGSRFNYLFIFPKAPIKRTRFYLGLGCAKNGAPHYELFPNYSTPSRTKHSTSFLNIPSCTFGTVYGLARIGFASSFNSKSTISVFQVPSVPSNNSSNFVIILAIHYVLFQSDVGTGFTKPHLNLPFRV